MVLWGFFFCLLISCTSYSDDNVADKLSVALSEVQGMEDCRRKSMNLDFYLHKYNAEKTISKYEGKENTISQENQRRFLVLRSEYSFRLSDYLYQIGKVKESQDVILALSTNTTVNIATDTIQWLEYLYHIGKVFYEPYQIEKKKENLLRGYDCTIQCYIISTRRGYKKYEALSLLTLSKYLRNDSIFNIAKEFDSASLRYINEENVNDSLLSIYLAERSLHIFRSVKDNYFTAQALHNLALCFFSKNKAQESLDYLKEASSIKDINKYPDLLANIDEQMSMCYAALDNKYLSDYYRNAYLDKQDSTRQDRQLEARAMSLEQSTHRIWIFVGCGCIIFLILCIATIILSNLRKKKYDSKSIDEELEILEEELRTLQLQHSNSQRNAVEQRARIAIINGMLPLIDRMKLAIEACIKNNPDEKTKEANLAYAAEVSEAIDTQNDMLTKWIKLKQGSIAPKIESFKIQDIFNIISKSNNVLQRSGITLNIENSGALVKADKTLTLFLVNTLMDNARKATPAGGSINISCTDKPEAGYAEIRVSDTGKGMTEEQLSKITDPLQTIQEGATHGFGLVNCKGIIERYRKISSLFSVCTFTATSSIGKGTTILFRLPIVKLVIWLILFFIPTLSSANTERNIEAGRLADSLYQCNINGRYTDAMLFADSCLQIVRNDSTIDADIRLSLYNETAVAALALHQWRKYRYYNYMYTMLYKQCTTDTTISTYCETLETNKIKANIAMLFVLLMTLSLIPIFWFTYLRHVINYKRIVHNKKSTIKEQKEITRTEFERLHVINNIISNQLSALKHETMYYPTRIRHLIESKSDIEDIASTVSYYRELYSTLSTSGLNETISSYSFHVAPLKLTEIIPNIDERLNCIYILGNTELLSYLFLLFKRHNSSQMPTVKVSETDKQSKDTQYIKLEYYFNNQQFTEKEISELFSANTKDADFIIMRQILREIGNSALRYATGISASINRGTPVITISLPLA